MPVRLITQSLELLPGNGSCVAVSCLNALHELLKGLAQNQEKMQTTEKLEDSYAVLKLPVGASFEEIRRQFKQKSLEVHPDRAGRAATAGFQALNSAHEKLVNTGNVMRHVRSQSNLG